MVFSFREKLSSAKKSGNNSCPLDKVVFYDYITVTLTFNGEKNEKTYGVGSCCFYNDSYRGS